VVPALASAAEDDDDRQVVVRALNGIGAVGKLVGPAALAPRACARPAQQRSSADLGHATEAQSIVATLANVLEGTATCQNYSDDDEEGTTAEDGPNESVRAQSLRRAEA
jgi:hypothetical protein